MATTTQLASQSLTAMLEPTTKIGISRQRREKFAERVGFKTFDDPELEKLLTACIEWATAFQSNDQPRWLSLFGTSGAGKTHCAKWLFEWSSARMQWGQTEFCKHVIYWPDFMQALRGGNAYALRDDIKRWPVLLLDDIGAAHETEFSMGELNTLCGCRENRWTIITANISFERIAKMDARVASRLIRGKNIITSVNTKDYATR